jgi:hypothetical protein
LTELTRETHGTYLKENLEPSGLEGQADAVASGTAGRRPADRFAWFLSVAISMLMWSAVREWPAKAVLKQLQTSFTRSTALAALLAMLTICTSALERAPATAVRAEADEEDVDALTPLRALVANIIAAPEPTAADYLELTLATVRYGDAQRGQSGTVVSGILSDGLAAAERGRALAPAIADWDGLEAALRRLSLVPPPVPDDGRPPDPANDPMAGSRDALEGGGQRKGREGKESPGDNAGNAREKQSADAAVAAHGLQGVGGSRRQVYDPAEWQDPSLVLPLHRLEQVRNTDSPAALFRIMQSSEAPVSRAGKQTW